MMLSTYILYALTIMLVSITGSYLYYHFKTGVPTFPTMPPMRRKMIEVLQDDAARRLNARPYTIIDLGSGSGQLSWRIARAMPHAYVIGIEVSIIPWMRSVIRQRLFGPSNLAYKRMDFWTYDTSKADAVVAYLLHPIMERVGQKLRKELKPGSIVLASKFPLGAGWLPYETFDITFPLPMSLLQYRQSTAANLNQVDQTERERVPENLLYAQTGIM